MVHRSPTTHHQTIRILIVDDHPIVREGLSSLLSREVDFEVCGEAGDIATALQQVEEKKPHIAIVDIALANESGLELIRRIAARDSTIGILACSLHDDTLYAERALHAGAMGYINKQEATATIVTAIRSLLGGKVHVSSQMTQVLTDRLYCKRGSVNQSPVESLSERELEVFRLIGRGLTTVEIARELHLGIKTIETHRRRMKQKLDVSTTAQLAREAAQWVLETH